MRTELIFNPSIVMTQLSFSANADGLQEATFTASESNVLQYHLSDDNSSKVLNVFIRARISSDMPWVLIKSFVGSAHDVIANLDIPEGVTVSITTNAGSVVASLAN